MPSLRINRLARAPKYAVKDVDDGFPAHPPKIVNWFSLFAAHAVPPETTCVRKTPHGADYGALRRFRRVSVKLVVT